MRHATKGRGRCSTWVSSGTSPHEKEDGKGNESSDTARGLGANDPTVSSGIVGTETATAGRVHALHGVLSQIRDEFIKVFCRARNTAFRTAVFANV